MESRKSETETCSPSNVVCANLRIPS